jgi:hypothetical protein
MTSKFESLVDQEFYGMYELLLGYEDPFAVEMFNDIKNSNMTTECAIERIKQYIVMRGFNDSFSKAYLKDTYMKDV